jgi:hypothetical protein
MKQLLIQNGAGKLGSRWRRTRRRMTGVGFSLVDNRLSNQSELR